MAAMRQALCALACVALTGGAAIQAPNRERLKEPDHPEINQPAPAVCRIRLDTSKGTLILEMQRAWSPHGADRFYNLVRHGYYDGARFFRVRHETWAQFGISADPEVATIWRTRTIPDDPRVLSNGRGTVAYAFKDPNGRTTQAFINLRDNAATHDGEPFVPFAGVIEGMAAADALYSGYGEQAGGGIRGGKQDVLFKEGNRHLIANFPRLDYIERASVMR
jgi:peptidyl-prolyl cis-trans isomerase A (cyclophilin A)